MTKYVVIDKAENIIKVGNYDDCLNEIIEDIECSYWLEYRIEKAIEHGFK